MCAKCVLESITVALVFTFFCRNNGDFCRAWDFVAGNPKISTKFPELHFS